MTEAYFLQVSFNLKRHGDVRHRSSFTPQKTAHLPPLLLFRGNQLPEMAARGNSSTRMRMHQYDTRVRTARQSVMAEPSTNCW